MSNQEYDPELQNPSARAKYLEDELAQAFAKAGWAIKRESHPQDSSFDFVAERPNVGYAVQVKIVPEGRGDRLIPAWSQAYLLAKHAAGNRFSPLPVIAAPQISSRLVNQLLEFAENYAPDAAIGIIDFQGLRIFRGPHLEGLDSETKSNLKQLKRAPRKQANLFSDLNQWMLKVLLASEIPPSLLSAPRVKCKNASELAELANVSVMTAFRFIEQLKQDGYLDESDHLSLVRRKDLLSVWQSVAALHIKELPVKYILRSDPKRELERVLRKGRKCLGLFAAANALHLGFVHGIPPHVYVSKVDDECVSAIPNIRIAEKNEAPDLILRQPNAPESVFRGIVYMDGIPVSDILQVWLDVSYHPSRGAEQADLIQRKIFENFIF